jgi:hypothetical protein
MKNVIIAVLAIAVLVEGYGLMMKKSAPVTLGATTQTQLTPRPSGRPPMPLKKGDTLAGSVIEKFAYEIVPTMTDDAKKALTGFEVNTKSLADGSTQADLTPKDSDDQFQSYVVKPGNKLYFIEMTPADDKPDTDRDSNYRDDYGIITDASGIVQ